MKFYSNKFLISFLVLTVVLYGFSVRVAEAAALVKIVDTVFNVILNTVLATIEVIVGNVLGVDWLSADGSCRFGNLSGKVIKTYADECGGDNGGGGGASGSPTLQDQTATPIVSSDGNCTTGFTLNYSVTDAYQYAIYRDS